MNKIKFSNFEIIPFDIWFLDRTKDFNDRKLLLGKTSKGKTIISLIETRIIDSQIFVDTKLGTKAEKIIKNEKNRVLYTRQQILSSKNGKPCGWTFGENVEIYNKKHQLITIKQKRCDYYGQKETIKTINHN